MWYYLLPFLLLPVFAQTATPSATNPPTLPPVPTPSINLTLSDIPDGAFKGDKFSAKLALNNAKPSTNYYFKVYGGPNGDNYSIYLSQNGVNVNGYNGSWVSMPSVITDSSGSAIAELTLQTDLQKLSGVYNLTGKAAETANTGHSVLSSAVSILISDIPTTVPPTDTPIPTDIPTHTPTPTPVPSVTPKPTAVPTPENSPTALPPDSPYPSAGDILGADSPSLTPTPTPKNTKLISASSGNLFPVILISLGAIILAIPLIVSKIKNKPT